MVAAVVAVSVSVAVAGCSGTPAPANVDDRTAARTTATMLATANDLTDVLGPGWELATGAPADDVTVDDLDDGECQGTTWMGLNDQDPTGFSSEVHLHDDQQVVTPSVRQQVRAVFREHHLTTITEAARDAHSTSITATGAAGRSPTVVFTYPTDGAGAATITGWGLCHR